jgi:hypothetical protein
VCRYGIIPDQLFGPLHATRTDARHTLRVSRLPFHVNRSIIHQFKPRVLSSTTGYLRHPSIPSHTLVLYPIAVYLYLHCNHNIIQTTDYPNIVFDPLGLSQYRYLIFRVIFKIFGIHAQRLKTNVQTKEIIDRDSCG